VIGWKEIPLGDVCELYQPPTISTAQLVDDGPYEVYGANGVIGRYHSYNHEEPQLLVTCRGATCGTVNRTGPKVWINGNAMVVRPRSSDIDMNYLEHLLRGGVDLSVAITGAAQPQITRQSLAPVRAKFPPLHEQRRIAAILDQADALRAKRQEALAQLDELQKAIFIEMFGDPATNPKGWNISNIGSQVTLQGGFAFKSGDYLPEGVRLVKISNVHKDTLSWDDVDYLPLKYIDEYKAFELKDGDIVIALTRPIIQSLESVKIAVVSLADEPCLLNQRVGRFVFLKNSKLRPEYLLGFCRSSTFFNAVRRFCSESLQPNMSTSQVEGLSIPIPPLTFQENYAERICALKALIEREQKSCIELDNLFTSLQHRAFQGAL